METLGELIDTVHTEGPVTPAMQAIMTYSQLASAALCAHGRSMIEIGNRTMPVGQASAVG